MSTANLDAYELRDALAAPGLIREDVMDTVYNLDEGIPTPFTDMVRAGSHSNIYSEWSEDDLTAVDTANAVVDGSDATGDQATLTNAFRVGNYQQISDKVVRISTTGELVNSVGGLGSMAYQTSRRLMDLRRDLEAIATGRQASLLGNETTASKTAGLAAWIATNTDFGATGSAGGFNTSTKVVDAPTNGTIRALTWANVRSRLEEVYNAGGYPSVLMSIPAVVKAINTFLFSTAGAPYRAAPTANVQGMTPQTQTAQGWITVVLSDFGIDLALVDNRLQQKYNSNTAADVFILDPQYLGLSYLGGYRNDVLGRTGLSDMRHLSVQWMTKCFREDAHALIADIDHTAAVTAS